MPDRRTTVLIVGAGSTLGHAQSLRPRRAKEHPPLDKTFFNCCQVLAPSHPTIARRINQLQAEIAAVGRFFDPFTRPEIPLEQFFADVYYEVASGHAPNAFPVFVRLLRLYNRVLSITTEWMLSVSRQGVLDRIIRSELGACEQLTIVTFNQDLLIEAILARMRRYAGQWCLRALYGDPDFTPLLAGKRAVFSHHERDCRHRAPLTLLKLHGSLNWVLRSRSSEPARSTLFPGPTRKVFIHDANNTSDSAVMTDAASEGRQSWYLWPLIVPPIYEKGRITAMRMLDELWSKAHHAIEKADRIVFIGYSLPDADVSASQMLRNAFSANTSLESVECVNPDPSLAGKLKERLDSKVVTLYDGLSTYLGYEGP